MVDLEKLFDLVYHMNKHEGEPFKLTNKVQLDRKQQGQLLAKTVQAFIHGVGEVDPNSVATNNPKVIQAFSGSSDLPQLTKDVFNVVEAVPYYDLMWQPVFKGIRLRKGQLSWEIADVSSGITFELVPEGGKAKFYGFSGSTQTVSVAKYGAGIGVTWEMIEGRKLYQFINQMEQVRAALYLLWANIHYGLLATAANSHSVAYQGIATDPVLDRDIRTINTGYTTIGNATKDKGYGDTANMPMYLYVSPLLKSRINQAMRATSPDIISGRGAGGIGSGGGEIVEYNVIPRYTWNSNIPANKGLLVLPGNKIQNSVYLQELSLSERNIETLAEMRSYWTAFGAVVADTEQCAELSFA